MAAHAIRPTNEVARIVEGSFNTLIGRGLSGGPQIGKMKKEVERRRSRVSRPFVARLLRLGLGLRPYLDSTRKRF